MKKPVQLTQAKLDKMTVAEVLSITADQIPEGYDIVHENGINPKLVKISEVIDEPVADEKEVVEKHGETLTGDGDIQKEMKELENSDIPEQVSKKGTGKYDSRSNKGILFLRFFKEDENNGKILTKLKGKVFFPQDETIEPGWYVATVVEEMANHGIMDTIALDKVGYALWDPRFIKGIFTKRNYKSSMLEIYPSVHREKLKIEQPPCIHKVAMPKKESKEGMVTISDIIKDKEKEALKSIFLGD